MKAKVAEAAAWVLVVSALAGSTLAAAEFAWVLRGLEQLCRL
jgi:hypothetical protein